MAGSFKIKHYNDDNQINNLKNFGFITLRVKMIHFIKKVST